MSRKIGRVAVVGRPNVGKSTLINEMIGYKLAITAHRPQTTLNCVHGVASADDYRIEFVDTPGIHIRRPGLLSPLMNKNALSGIQVAEVVLWMVEACKWTREDIRVGQVLEHCDIPILLVINKIDLFKGGGDNALGGEAVLGFIKRLGEHFPGSILPISAFCKKDVTYLVGEVCKHLPSVEVEEAEYDVNNFEDNTLPVVCEFIREKCIRLLYQELPYQISVMVNRFEQKKKLVAIDATIYVNKMAQKKMVVGHRGEMIKKIGSDARASIEGLLGQKVVLKLWVKVAQGWVYDRRLFQQHVPQ